LVIFLPGGVLGGVSIWVRKALAKISS
jgi:hypothetical protein